MYAYVREHCKAGKLPAQKSKLVVPGLGSEPWAVGRAWDNLTRMKTKAEAQALKVLYDLPAWTGADGKQHQPFKAYLDSPKRKDKLDKMQRWLATADSGGKGEKRAKKRQRTSE